MLFYVRVTSIVCLLSFTVSLYSVLAVQDNSALNSGLNSHNPNDTDEADILVSPGHGILYSGHPSDSVSHTAEADVKKSRQYASQGDNEGILESVNLVEIISHKTTRLLLKALLESWSLPTGYFDFTDASNPCIRDLGRLINGTLSGEEWTVSFVDSSAKPGISMALGWINLVGNPDQCRDSRAPPPPGGDTVGFKGEYCVVSFPVKSPIVHPKFGLCFPSTCSETDIKHLLTDIFEKYKLNIGVKRVECLHGNTDVTAATVCAIIALSFIGSLMLLGTFYDMFYVHDLFPGGKEKESHTTNGNVKSAESIMTLECNKSCTDYKTISNDNLDKVSQISPEEVKRKRDPFPELMVKIIIPFSVYTNGRKLLSVSVSPDSVSCLFGLRYLSIAWVILAHIYYFGMYPSLNRNTKEKEYLDKVRYQTASNAFLAVDTFFVMSGLLTSYLLLKEINKNKKGWRINWGMFYFHRFWRLTPPYMLVILISLGLTQYLGEGPLWSNSMPRDKKFCEDDWWRNLLYINNLANPKEMCMYHAWYLANDMQFFLLSPLMIVPFYFHHLAGIASCLGFLFASWIATFVLSMVNDWTPTPVGSYMSIPDRIEFEEEYYVKPWCRIGPFIVGVLAGYLLTLIKPKEKPVYLKYWVVALGWLVSTVIALAALYGLDGDISGDRLSSRGVAALYNTFARSAWAVSISWIILACHTGYGGPVNVVLSWPPFVVLGRLTYMTYLLHPYIMYIYYDSLGMPYMSNDPTMTMTFCGFLFFSTLAAFFFNLALESPMLGLEKTILSSKKQRK